MVTIRLRQDENHSSLLVQTGSTVVRRRIIHRPPQSDWFGHKRHHRAPNCVLLEMPTPGGRRKRQIPQHIRSSRSLSSRQQLLIDPQPSEVQIGSLHVKTPQLSRPKGLADDRNDASRMQTALQHPRRATPVWGGPLLAHQTRGTGARIRN